MMKKIIFLLMIFAIIPFQYGCKNPPDPTGKHVIGNLPISHRDIYFCKGKFKTCEKPLHVEEKWKHCLTGTWKMENGKIKVRYEREYGTRGVGKAKDIAAAVQLYDSYEDFKNEKSGGMEITNWDEMNNDKSGMWKIEKYSGGCE
jgi:hypothetical protein